MKSTKISHSPLILKRKSPYSIEKTPQKQVKLQIMGLAQFTSFLQSLTLNYLQLSPHLQYLITIHRVQIFEQFDDDLILTDCTSQCLTPSQQQWLIKSICKLGINHSFWNELSAVLHRTVEELKQIWDSLQDEWSNQQDNRLILLLNQQLNWLEISQQLEKSTKSCKYRWNNTLNPNIKTDAFNPDEDIQLLKLVIQYNYEWKKIQKVHTILRSQHALISRFITLIEPFNSDEILFNRVQLALKQNEHTSLRLLNNNRQPQQIRGTVEYECGSIKNLQLYEALELRCCLIKEDQIYLVTNDYVQQLVNLKNNQRRLLQFMK